ncbi:MAG TPA: hypothetical protein VMF07_05785 [Solirubrobacteraceae bacterium]|nr:hypothetical protein [Solirubrobacteraceae bacterium]
MAPITTRIRRLFGELGYAQRRSFELQTGVPLSDPQRRSLRHQRQIDHLDALWSRHAR